VKKTVHSKEVKTATFKKLFERGVTPEKIAEITFEMQKPYQSDLTIEQCIKSVYAVLEKREIQHAILVGIELDQLAEKRLLSEPLQTIVETDESLFGVDETIALGSVLGYGSIGVTTFGHLDKHKIGIIKNLDTKRAGNGIHTFLDDLVAAIAAAASSRIAHHYRDRVELENDLLVKDEFDLDFDKDIS